ncbi:30S ribosomal protein S18 [Patescibacteria group bacterium]|nr:30S ribosomal protein S18 [Patescibacteria group bacterium]
MNSNTNQKHCYFCIKNIREIDYKDIELLRRFISAYERILPKRKRGTCSKHQRKLARAIKRARIMALLPFVKK